MFKEDVIMSIGEYAREWLFVLLLTWSATSLLGCGGGGSSSPPTFTVGGTLSGLAADESVVLNENGGSPLTVSANSTFTFPTAITAGGSYSVTIGTQPAGQACSVSSGSGSINASNVTTVSVICSNAYTISGTVSGLTSGASVVLQNNGIDSLTVGSNSTFTFSIPIKQLGSYNVTVGTQPSGQTCTVSSGVGGPLLASVNNVIVQCASEVVLWSFGSGTDGRNPWGALIQGSDGTLYGTTNSGGTFSQGTVYKVTLGGAETVLWNFCSGTDGCDPFGALVLGKDGNLYGTTYGGGTSKYGTVYRITPGGVETVLWNFGTTVNDGQNPRAGLILANDGNFYGTTENGGIAGYGTVFMITPGGAETVLWSFWTVVGDAQTPWAPLIQASDGNFYSTSSYGGAADWGTAYGISPSGAEAVLWSFIPSSDPPSDGFGPVAPLVEGSDGYLYGTTYVGGDDSGLCPCGNGSGAVVRIDKAGTSSIGYVGEESVIWRFGASGPNDGAGPEAGLIIGTDGNFYGTTSSGGAYMGGTAFKLTPTGIESVLWSFGSGADAKNLQSALLQGSDGNFYGVSVTGGANNEGAVFRLTP